MSHNNILFAVLKSKHLLTQNIYTHMAKEVFLIGVAGVILGIGIFIKTHKIVPALIPIIIGIALILFYKEEDKIENRKDIKNKKTKK